MLERLDDRCLLSSGYVQTNLVSDIPHLALHTDPDLVNPWGISVGGEGNVRVSDNGSGLSTAYTSDGTAHSSAITIPPPAGSPDGTTAAPTGNVLNTTSDFVIQAGHRSGPARFVFATEDGTLSGWNPGVDRTHAILTVDNSDSDAVYKGLALGRNAHGNFLFATNFHAGTIDVFDAHFHQVHLTGSFIDPELPPPPIGEPGFAPFGIQNIGGNLFVTYALQKPDQHDDMSGPGNGFVDVFDTNGHLLRRFASQGTLNSPWGMAVAPDDFGRFSHSLLVGDFGDGRINAFNRRTGAFLGQLADTARQPITIDGLWGLAFGRGSEEDDGNTLFFAAGINDEADGLLGTLTPADTEAPESDAGAGSRRADDAGRTAVVALLPPLVEGSGLAVQSSVTAPANPTTGTQNWTALNPTLWLTDVVSVGAESREVTDRALGEFQASLFDQVFAYDLADPLAT
jgi:uncharacterized protein (TIGR03118 family)